MAASAPFLRPLLTSPPASPEESGWRRLTGPTAAMVLLAAFWGFLVASTRDLSLTFDEPGHAAGGFTYWKFQDYRLDPESGNLPQRVFALPLLARRDRTPATDSAEWRSGDKWVWSYRWFYQLGNDAAAMALAGRAAAAGFAVALGGVVWLWTRRHFGRRGALVALVLYALNPTILANGALMTADVACALFFVTATWALWVLLQRITVTRVLLSALAVGALCVTKASAVLIVPIAGILVAARLLANRPLPIHLLGARTVTGRPRQALAFAAVAGVHAAVVIAMIWSFYGFRYAAFAPGQPGGWQADTWEFVLGRPSPQSIFRQLELDPARRQQIEQTLEQGAERPEHWTPATLAAVRTVRDTLLQPPEQQRLDALLAAPPPAAWPRLVGWMRTRRVLPEAYLYGLAYVWRYAHARPAFLNGAFTIHGSPWFFPYTFLVKTPLALLGIVGLAALAAVIRRRLPWYELIPWGALLAVYWTVAVSSHFNIGHRHILLTYPILAVLGGAAAAWWHPAGRRMDRVCGAGLALLLVAHAAESFAWFPRYLAYFNGLVAPSRAYRHLVDSSLDWGQDLPAVQRFLTEHPSARPAYLSFFGIASPAYYRVEARPLYSFPDLEQLPPLNAVDVPIGTDLRDLMKTYPAYDPAVIGQADEASVRHLLLIKKAAAFRITGGTYLISATMLQPVTTWPGAWGPWNARYEEGYQAVSKLVEPMLQDDPAVRRAALPQLPPAQWLRALADFDQLRFMRLTAFLRQREPDDTLNYSILVYRLSDAELDRALHGPPPPLGPDVPTLPSTRPP